MAVPLRVTAADAVLHDREAITVQGVLRLPALRRGRPRVVACRDRLDRPIRWVHAGEIPQLPEALRGGELVLTTGMGLGSRAPRQRDFVRRLANRGVAGLVLELGQCFGHAPDALVAAAEAHGLPIIVLDRPVAFIDVAEAIQERILAREVTLARAAERAHEHFTTLMLDGGGVPELIRGLADMIANPVLLERAEPRGLLCQAAYRTPDDRVLAAWQESGSELRDDDDGMAVPVPAGSDATWGRLIVLALDSQLDEFDRVVVQRSASAIAIALLRRHEEERIAARERGDYLADLLTDRINVEDVALRAEALGFERHGKWILTVAASAPSGGRRQLDVHDWIRIRQATVDELRSSGIPAIVAARVADQDMLMLCNLSALERRPLVMDKIVSAARGARGAAVGANDLVVVGGRPVSRWSRVAESLREVNEAVALVRHRAPQPWFDAMAPDVDRLLWQLRDTPSLRRYVLQHLGPLIEHDRRSSTALLPTLESFLDHAGNKTDSARALHVTRQALYYRLRRIESILGVSVADPTVRLALHVAVRAQCFISEEPPPLRSADAERT